MNNPPSNTVKEGSAADNEFIFSADKNPGDYQNPKKSSKSKVFYEKMSH
jgi:hypothetical protein